MIPTMALGTFGLGYYQGYTGESTTPPGLFLSMGAGFATVAATYSPSFVTDRRRDEVNEIIQNCSVGVVGGAVLYGTGYVMALLSKYAGGL